MGSLNIWDTSDHQQKENVEESLSVQHGGTSQAHGQLQGQFYRCVHTCTLIKN